MHLIARLGFGQGLGMLRLDGGEERKNGGGLVCSMLMFMSTSGGDGSE